MVSKDVGIRFGFPFDVDVGGDGGKLFMHGGLAQAFPDNRETH